MWTQEEGGWGWGNNELQYYTSENRNALVKDGMLIIESRIENTTPSRAAYTSARLVSKRAFKYGIFEMRARLPNGRGSWPAFWLLSANRPVNWPMDGEIDILGRFWLFGGGRGLEKKS
jgi:beta-glucanase (GH16 family)